MGLRVICMTSRRGARLLSSAMRRIFGSTENPTMDQREKEIETRLIGAIAHRPESVRIRCNNLPYITSFRDLFGAHEYQTIQDNSIWNPFGGFMKDVIGGMCPDIVFRSKVTNENRIIIEVKDTEKLGYQHYGIEDSQVVRYFLHLLATSTKDSDDIHRAVLLCAPPIWFADAHNAKAWGYFLEHFSGLAAKFRIALGEVYSDTF